MLTIPPIKAKRTDQALRLYTQARRFGFECAEGRPNLANLAMGPGSP